MSTFLLGVVLGVVAVRGGAWIAMRAYRVETDARLDEERQRWEIVAKLREQMIERGLELPGRPSNAWEILRAEHDAKQPAPTVLPLQRRKGSK